MKDMLGDFHVLGLDGGNQAINFVRAATDALRAQLEDKPKSEVALNSPEGLSWRYMTLLRIGEVNGTLKALKAFGHLEVAEAEVLLRESLGAVMRAMEVVNMQGAR